MNQKNGCTSTSCRCVGPTLLDRCVAIRQYVRPEDVKHLIKVVPLHQLPRGYTSAGSVAQWMRGHLASGSLRYIPDPPTCDRWGRPAETFRRGGGDCDDLAILVASCCRAMNVRMAVIVGIMCNSEECGGHAWVEGEDEAGGFLIEATTGDIRRVRPPEYERHFLLTPESCAVAPEHIGRETQRMVAHINAAVEIARQNELLRRAFGIAS